MSSPVLRTPEEWCARYGLEIADPDGWRHPNAPSWDTPLGLPEFWRRFRECTVRMVDRPTYERITADLRAVDGPEEDGRP